MKRSMRILVRAANEQNRRGRFRPEIKVAPDPETLWLPDGPNQRRLPPLVSVSDHVSKTGDTLSGMGDPQPLLPAMA